MRQTYLVITENHTFVVHKWFFTPLYSVLVAINSEYRILEVTEL